MTDDQHVLSEFIEDIIHLSDSVYQLGKSAIAKKKYAFKSDQTLLLDKFYSKWKDTYYINRGEKGIWLKNIINIPTNFYNYFHPFKETKINFLRDLGLECKDYDSFVDILYRHLTWFLNKSMLDDHKIEAVKYFLFLNRNKRINWNDHGFSFDCSDLELEYRPIYLDKFDCIDFEKKLDYVKNQKFLNLSIPNPQFWNLGCLLFSNNEKKDIQIENVPYGYILDENDELAYYFLRISESINSNHRYYPNIIQVESYFYNFNYYKITELLKNGGSGSLAELFVSYTNKDSTYDRLLTNDWSLDMNYSYDKIELFLEESTNSELFQLIRNNLDIIVHIINSSFIVGYDYNYKIIEFLTSFEDSILNFRLRSVSSIHIPSNAIIIISTPIWYRKKYLDTLRSFFSKILLCGSIFKTPNSILINTYIDQRLLQNYEFLFDAIRELGLDVTYHSNYKLVDNQQYKLPYSNKLKVSKNIIKWNLGKSDRFSVENFDKHKTNDINLELSFREENRERIDKFVRDIENYIR